MALGTQQQKTIIAISKCEYRGVLIYETATGCTVILGGKQHDFISLGEERYDLAIPRADFESPRLRVLLDAFHSVRFRQTAQSFAGYDLARMGKVVARVK